MRFCGGKHGCGLVKPADCFYRGASYCRPCELRRQRAAYAARCRTPSGKRSAFARTMKFKYGITFVQWTALLLAQTGRCAICVKPMEVPCVDHCHASGRVRGLLCDSCNRGLGAFRDTPAFLQTAIHYLQEA